MRKEKRALKKSLWSNWEFLLRAGHLKVTISRCKTKWNGGKKFTQMRFCFLRTGVVRDDLLELVSKHTFSA